MTDNNHCIGCMETNEDNIQCLGVKKYYRCLKCGLEWVDIQKKEIEK